MKRILQKTLFACLLASCAFGLDIKPDSLSLALKSFDTITLYNNANDQIQIDTIFIKFQNGDSVDFERGKACDSANVSCYNYSGWSYGWSESSATTISLRYVKDSLFLLQNSTGNPIEYTISPHDSLQFVVSTIVNCPACDRMPIFPATTKFQYAFITNDGQKASFLLTLNRPTNVSSIEVSRRYPWDGRPKAFYNLRGQKMDSRSPFGIIVQNNKIYFRLDWNTRELPNGK